MLFKIYDIKNLDTPITVYEEQHPLEKLKIFNYIKNHENDITIEFNNLREDKYAEANGYIEKIIFQPETNEDIDCITIYMEVFI